MGTNCYVGHEKANGEIHYVYVHYDGYLEGVGKFVVNLDGDMLDELIEGGGIRSLGEEVVRLHESYGETLKKVAYDEVEFYRETVKNVDYSYLLDRQGNWWVLCIAPHAPIMMAKVWSDLRAALNMPVKQCNSTPNHGKVDNMQTNEIIGYQVKSGEQFVHAPHAGGGMYISYEEPLPVSQADAYRRVAGFIEQHPTEVTMHGVPTVHAVYRQTTPAEDAAHELGGLLESLCRRHKLDLGLTRVQLDSQILKELEAIKAGASPSLGFIAGGIPRPR